MQIHPGHIVFEKRRPALVDSAFQSFVLAPFFVMFDVLFSLGYRPLLHKKLQVSQCSLDSPYLIEEDTIDWDFIITMMIKTNEQ